MRSLSKLSNLAVAVLCGILLLLSSCGQVREKYAQVDPESWSRSKPQEFELNVPSKGVYALYIDLRYMDGFQTSNIWLHVQTRSQGGKPESHRLNLPLFEREGARAGMPITNGWHVMADNGMTVPGEWRSGSTGRVYGWSYPDTELGRMVLEPGTFQVRIGHDMREENIKGLTSVGVRLKRIN